MHLYWAEEDQWWVLDTDTDPRGIAAYYSGAFSRGFVLPSGSATHFQEWCNGGWNSVSLSVQETFTSSNCVSLVATMLASSACAGEVSTCSAACAEIWLPGLERCADHVSAFDTVASMTSDCQDAANGIIATAPSQVTVSGLQCHDNANAVYSLMPVPFNGRPQFISSDGQHKLTWSPTSVSGASIVWEIDGSGAQLDSPADELPVGSAVWQEQVRYTL